MQVLGLGPAWHFSTTAHLLQSFEDRGVAALGGPRELKFPLVLLLPPKTGYKALKGPLSTLIWFLVGSQKI